MSILIKGIDMPKEGLYELSFAQSGGVTICLIEKLDLNGGGTIIDHDGVVEVPTLPSAERKHGKWVTEDGDWYWCSVCGKSCLQWGDESFALSNYCPNCGADMKGEKDDEIL